MQTVKPGIFMRHLVIFLLVLFQAVAAYGDEPPCLISVDEFSVRGVSIGSTYDEIVKKLGKPLTEHREISEVSGGPSIDLHYNGMEIYILDDETMNIRIVGGPYKLKSGIGIGSAKQTVYAKLGKTKPHRGANGRISLQYTVTTPMGDWSDAVLIIYLRDDTVNEIVFWFPYV